MGIGLWMMDLRQAVRSLKRTPGFAATAVGMLGLAIGATTGMYSVVDAVLLDRLPFAEPDRLVHIAASAPGAQMPEEFGVSAELFLEYQEQSKLLVDVSTYGSFSSTLRVGERVERVRMSWPTNSMYSTLGVAPALGRLPASDDENGAIVISDKLWSTWFDRDPGVIGRSYSVAGEMRRVIGVMPPAFRFPTSDTMLWVANELKPAEITELGDFDIDLVGRLAPGATPATLADELTQIAKRVPARYGGSAGYARVVAQHRAVVRPLEAQMLGAVQRPLWVLLGATAIVLLIACANVANLFLVRTEGRHRELALRRALGAARGKLIRLQLAESIVVAMLAGGGAVVLAAVVLPVFVAAAPAGVPRIEDVGVRGSTLAFAALASACCALICGGLPALRGSAPDLARLREGGRGSTAKHRWLRNALVAGQTALALVLLIGSGLLLRSAYALRHVDPGYDTRDIFTFQMAPERPSLDDAASYARFNLEFLRRLAALPGVESAGLIENIPLNESSSPMRIRTELGAGATEDGVPVQVTFTAGDYFEAMGIALLGGRAFTAADQTTSRGNVVVSRRAAEHLWPGLDPVGRRIKRQEQEVWETVVGVVEDIKQDALQETTAPLIYFPVVDTTPDGGVAIGSPGYVVRTRQADTIAPQVRALVREIAPEAPMYRAYTMAELVARSMLELSFTLLTLGIAAGLALILGMVGLYAVLSYIVAERTREIGVRMALGAPASRVQSMVVAHGARVLGAGVAIGVLLALAFTRSLGGLLYGVQPFDLATFVGMPLAMAAVGLLASYLPARRASALNPVESLRRD